MSTPKRRTIKTDYLARVEGEGAMSVLLVDGKVDEVELRIFEPPRFFEALRPMSFVLLLVIINLPPPFNFVRQILRPVRVFADQLVVWSASGQWL